MKGDWYGTKESGSPSANINGFGYLMRVLKGIQDLSDFFSNHDSSLGCLADTGFLYAISYDDDRLFEKANVVLDMLADHDVPIFANVISRVEFIDLIFRKQVTLGAVQMFEMIEDSSKYKNFFNFLKHIRDQNTAHKRQQSSYKIDERSLKRLRHSLKATVGLPGGQISAQNSLVTSY